MTGRRCSYGLVVLGIIPGVDPAVNMEKTRLADERLLNQVSANNRERSYSLVNCSRILRRQRFHVSADHISQEVRLSCLGIAPPLGPAPVDDCQQYIALFKANGLS